MYVLYCKPPSLDRILGFVDSHKKLAIVAREVNFGVVVASMFWTERLAIEITTGMDTKGLNEMAYEYLC